MKEFRQKILQLKEDIQVETELRWDGYFKKKPESNLKPVRPFMDKLRPEILGGILFGVGMVGTVVWLINRLVNRKKD